MNTRLPQHLVDILYSWVDGNHEKANEIIEERHNKKIIFKLARSGDPYAAYLASKYSRNNGKDGTVDYLFKCLEKEGLFEPAMITALFVCTEDKTFKVAQIIMQTLAKSKYSAAHSILAAIYEKGYYGIPTNMKKAMEEYEKSFAIIMGNNGVCSEDDEIIYNEFLGDISLLEKLYDYYSDEENNTTNYPKVIELCNIWLDSAAAGHDAEGISSVFVRLADAYRCNGNYKKAVEIFLSPRLAAHGAVYSIVVRMYLDNLVALDNNAVEEYAHKALALVKAADSANSEVIDELEKMVNAVIARGKEEKDTGIVHVVPDENEETLIKYSEQSTNEDADIEVQAGAVTTSVASPNLWKGIIDCEEVTNYRLSKKLGKGQISLIITSLILVLLGVATGVIFCFTPIRSHIQSIIVIILTVIAGAIMGVAVGYEYNNRGNSIRFKKLLYVGGGTIVLINAIGLLLLRPLLITIIMNNGAMVNNHISGILTYAIFCAVPIISGLFHCLMYNILRRYCGQVPSILWACVSAPILAVVVAVAIIYFVFKFIFSIFGSGDNTNANPDVKTNNKLEFDNGYYLTGNTLYTGSGVTVGSKYEFGADKKFYDSGKLVAEIKSDKLVLYK